MSTFFDTQGAGDPVLLQHLIWLLGHPETWLYIGMWLLVATAVILGAIRFRKAGKTVGAVLLVAAFLVLIAGYAWLSTQSWYAMVEGDFTLAGIMGLANYGLIAAAIGSAVWLIAQGRNPTD